MSLTKRGKRVRAVAIVVGVWALWMVASNLWWVGVGNANADFFGWCWGSMTQCVVL